ncbi:MAG TPA: M1 family metallopeptidase [Chitinophagaceae bacterium]|nr:M1 family metallopeptidase [Chitinophagaceae bacterium]
MKNFIFSILLIVFHFPVAECQRLQYWQQQVNYKIEVALNDKEHTLDGFEKLQYFNNSPDTLKFIWFHLWPNAYKNDKTAFSDQFLSNGRTDFYFANEEQRGYINRLDFRINDIVAKTEDHPNYIDVIKIILPQPLVPGTSIDITTPFHVKLPQNFSRGGHLRQAYQITQWYPKPAVYDYKGWHPIPYLDQGEFYSEFGNYEVKITIPENYVVAATGDLQNEDEKNWLLTRVQNVTDNQPQNIKFKNQISSIKKTAIPIQKSSTTNQKFKTIIYKQNNVHDFAWFADKNFIVKHDTTRLASGRVIDVYAFCLPDGINKWKNSISFIKKTVHSRSQWIGEYAYNTISVVEAKLGTEGGMEYPTITSISPPENEKSLEGLIEHEVGHNWFFGMIGSHERKHPWMDEGINSYYDGRYDKEINKTEDGNVSNERFLAIIEAEKKDQPIETSSENFTSINYDLIVYYKTSKWLQLVEKELGRDVFDKAMQEYFKRWQFKHPYPEDLKKVLEEISGKKLDNLFLLLTQKGIFPNEYKDKPGIIFLPTTQKKLANLFTTGNKTFLLSPVAGGNSYDQLMIGAGITNYLPPNGNFRFLLVPMYSTGAKTITGLGRLSYRWFPKSTFETGEIFVAASKFTYSNVTDDYNKKTSYGFIKKTTGLKFTFKEKKPESTLKKYLQIKSFFFTEGKLTSREDTIRVTDPDTFYIKQSYGSKNESRQLNQLKFVVENSRTLYPYSFELQAEQTKGLIRTSFTGNYYFNYAKGGGINLRFFAGKIFYTRISNPADNYNLLKYQFQLSGANGNDDYTYSNYFIGRNEQLNLWGQQIAIRDGGFKVRSDLLSNEIGNSDNWLTAINLTSTVPDNLNILNVLPVKIPLKIFFDIGTYSDAWKKDAEETKFLFDGGLQICLFKDIVNIYIPLIYSNRYSDYFKSFKPDTKFLRNISFSIDLQNIRLGKVLHNSIF